MSAGPQIQTAFIHFYTYVSCSSCWWMAASNLLQTILKKSKLYKITFFSRLPASGYESQATTSSHKPPQAATCSHLQPLAAICSLQPLVASWASGCKCLQMIAFSKIKMMHVCSLSESFEVRGLFPVYPTISILCFAKWFKSSEPLRNKCHRVINAACLLDRTCPCVPGRGWSGRCGTSLATWKN